MDTPKNTNRKYLGNSIWLIIEKASRIVSGILVGVLVARYLGTEQFGMLSYALTITVMLSLFSTLGMDSIIMRELVKQPELENEIMGTAFVLKFAGSFVSITAAVIIGYNDHSSANIVFLLSIVSVSILLQSINSIDLFFQSQVKGKLVAINQVITLTLSAIIKLLLIYIGAPLIAFATMVVIEAIITAFNQVIFYRKKGGRLHKWYFSREQAISLLKPSFPIIVSSLLIVLYQKLDVLLIKGMLNFDQLGNYSAGARMSEAWYFIPMAAANAVFPGIINASEDKPFQLKRITQVCSLLLWVAIVISIGMVLLGDWIVLVLYGTKFPASGSILKMHIWTTLPIFFGIAWNIWILVENKQKISIYYNVVTLAFSLGLNMLLIPLYGITGSAISAFLSYSIGILFALALYKPATSYRMLLDSFNPVFALQAIKYLKKGL